MVTTHPEIVFILNDSEKKDRPAPGLSVLDYVREKLWLTGTKEGCKEGDCGACLILVGSAQPDGTVSYLPVTSCLMPAIELHGKHLVTVEGLRCGEALSPVQQAMVECGGTQCGYCTPGFVVAMTAGLMDEQIPLNEAGVQYAISGNLCRCTGYQSILKAGQAVTRAIKGESLSGSRVTSLIQSGFLPRYFEEIPLRLAQINEDVTLPAIPYVDSSQVNGSGSRTAEVILAGGTDLYVQQGRRLPDAKVRFLNQETPHQPARNDQGMITLDARMTFEAFVRDPVIRSCLPGLDDYNLLISSWPVRTRSSLGGNICNASPIADMTCLLLALESDLDVVHPDGGKRTVALASFFKGYKQLDLLPGEWIEQIRFPDPGDSRVHWEKVSKRAWLDIASVNAAGKVKLRNARVESIHLSLGGVAPVPLKLEETASCLLDQPLSSGQLLEALNCMQGEISPISDVRGSARYKRLLARQLLLAIFEKTLGDVVNVEDLHAAL